MAPAPILQRVGFSIDFICPESNNLEPNGCTRVLLDGISLYLAAAKRVELINYDLVILGDDQTIGGILDANFSVETKLKLLPVIRSQDFDHLYSKCQLSKILFESQIQTPDFKICHSLIELLDESASLGYPNLVKIDRSGGGSGVFECFSEQDIFNVKDELIFPILLQKKIFGRTIDLSAFYQNGQLIYFSYSAFVKTIGGKFGPSSVRKYTQAVALPSAVRCELQAIGIALGANGFVNITAIECEFTGSRFYIEADMRPNVWADYGKYVGDDPVPLFRKYFLKEDCLERTQEEDKECPISRYVSYINRLSLSELILNKYGVWDQFGNRQLAFQFIWGKVGSKFRGHCNALIRPYIPSVLWDICYAIYKKL